MIHIMIQFIKEAIFITNVFFIISSELILYGIFRNYSSFIDGITSRLASINILYVKVFQALALNNSLIDDKTNNKLLHFTDNAPWAVSDINLMGIIEVCDMYDLYLKDGFEKPINSGMISLVFKANRKLTSEPIIIKMKRTNIDIKLNDAIKNLQTFMYILSFIPLINKYQIAEVVNKNIDIICHQTNFSEEVENMLQFKTNCKNLKYVKIPEVYKEVTEKYPDVIMMEFIEGIKINQIKEEDYNGFAKSIMKLGFVTTIIHGFAHGDLHGGNILFIKDDTSEKHKYKLGVIDFGIMYELDSTFKETLFNIFTQMFELPSRETAIQLLNSGILKPCGVIESLPKNHRENIIIFTTEIIEETIHKSKSANQIQLYKFLHKLTNYLCNSEIANIGIKPSDNLVKTQLVLAMSHGVTLTLCKDEFSLLADQVINELFCTPLEKMYT